jgi:hypothetical protein
VARSRNLGDVLHYFISEEEQREARSQASTAERASDPPPARAPRYCLPADPERPLTCSLALELAGGMAAESSGARVLARFAPSPLLPRVSLVRWDVVTDLADALAAAPESEPAMAVERPVNLGALLGQLPADALDGVVMPIEAAHWGLGKTLGFLRGLAPALAGRRVLGLVVGAESPAAARELIARLASAARRQHGIEIEFLGELARDAESYRSLLRGDSLHALGDASATAQSLRALCQRLSQRLAA